ncbi:hypothetical protein D3C72_1676220 [compost metagenome]
MHTAGAALHAESRAPHARDRDRGPDFEAAYALAGGGDGGFDATALNMDDGVGQRGAFELAQPGQFDRAASGQCELGAIGELQGHKPVGRSHYRAAFSHTGA